MDVTGHYGIKKPGENDYADVAVLNENADAIDAALHDLETGKAGLDPETGKVKAEQMPPMDYVPTGRKVNGKALSGDIALTAEDVGAVAASGGDVSGDINMRDAQLNARAIGLHHYDRNYDDDRILISTEGPYEISLFAVDGGDVNLSRIKAPFRDDHAANKEYVDSKTLVFGRENIETPAWVADSTYSAQGYHWRASVYCPGVTASHRPDVAFGPEDAVSGNFAPVADSFADGVYVYAKTKPTANVLVMSIACIRGA